MQYIKRPDIKNFDYLMKAITKPQTLFDVSGDMISVAGFELPVEMYDSLDKTAVITGEVQWAVAQQNELLSQMDNQLGILPNGITADLQSLFNMLEDSLGYIGEVQFQSICTLLDLLQVSELIAKASAQMLIFAAQDTGGGDSFLGTLFGGVSVAAGVAGVAGLSGTVTGTTLSLGSLGGPPGIALALAVVAAMAAVGVGISNANNKKKRGEAAEEITSRIDNLSYADNNRRSNQYDLLFDNKNEWRESLEQAQEQSAKADTAATDTIIGLLQQLVDKPLSRNVNAEVHIQELYSRMTQTEFRENFLEMMARDMQTTW
ncbi:MAG TPA: hypothetical protein VN626_08880 [Clostridia bacterium]|nr:hypothetical protein [Clostridia bacterium]